MKRFTCLLFFSLYLIMHHSLEAGTLKGVLVDTETQEPLIGAYVILKNEQFNTGASSNLDGSYIIKNIPAGTYQIIAKNVGYTDSEIKEVTVAEEGDFTMNFSLMLHHVEVIVKGKKADAESDRSARVSEHNADNVVNVMSAQTMQLLPDITVANVLQRVSGVTVQRNSEGEGRYAIIRGMDQRYNYTMINGIKIPSPNDKYRYVPMDIFPSDLLERLEVFKTLTPSMEGDAIGGVMNLVMKNAPDTFYLNANVSGGYSQLFFDRSFASFDQRALNSKSPSEIHGPSYLATQNDFPRSNMQSTNIAPPPNAVAGLSIGNRFFHKKIGLIVGGSYQNNYRGSNSTYVVPATVPFENNIANFSHIYAREYSTHQIRKGLQAKIDYVISPRNKISLFTVYTNMDEIQSRHTVDTSLSAGRQGFGYGTVDELFRARYEKQTIYNNTLQGNHTLFRNMIPALQDQFNVNWSGVYSIAKRSIPDWTESDRQHYATPDSNTGTIVMPYSRRWLRNSDEDLSGYLNLSYKFKIQEFDIELSAGGLYRSKKRDNYYNEYNLTAVPVNGQAQPYRGFENANYELPSTDGQGSPVTPNTYTANEQILAYYGQGKITWRKFNVIGGVRIEKTQQDYKTAQNPNTTAASAKIAYQDILPSINFKYTLTPKQNFRLSYFKSICRPGFGELVPYQIQGELFLEEGNPYLKHTVAHNYDARYEFFPKGADQILIGVFYKSILNPVELSFAQHGTHDIYISPSNFGNAQNTGFELVVTKYFGVFGVSANYTYTSSKITTNKGYIYRDQNTGFVTTKLMEQTRPLQGQSPHVANVSLLYKNSRNGLDVQLAFVYTGKKITQVSLYYGLDYWQRGTYQLDFSAEKKIGKGFSAYCKIGNLLNSPVIVEIIQSNTHRDGGVYALPYQTRDDRVLVQREYYYQTYLVGLRYKFQY